MYKFDTHVHTCETSECGQVEARETVKLYKEAGYEGIVITDHYYEGFFQSLEELSWDDKIDRYLRGYKNAVAEGTALGMIVILGIELRFTENPNDYLIYGITEAFLKENTDFYKMGLKKFKKLIENEDILIFQAHPYRPGMVPADPQDIHGVEVFNGNPRHNSRNSNALLFAKENGLMMSSGSDFHQTEDLARGGIIFLNEITSSSQFVEALRKNEIKELLSTNEEI